MKQTIYDIVDNKGYRRGHLADVLGVSPGTIIRWNSKETRPSRRMLKKLCEFLEVDEDKIDLKNA